MERHFKGAANHYRLDILLLINKEKGITVEGIADRLKANFKTVSQHTRYLAQAGLIQKKYKGRAVEHVLSPYGSVFAEFIKNFQRVGF